jgi:serine/threonine protein kinase
MVPSRPPPQLQDASKWSKEFNDFVCKMLTKNPDQRPTAHELLEVITHHLLLFIRSHRSNCISILFVHVNLVLIFFVAPLHTKG